MDAEVYNIIFLSLVVTIASTIIAACGAIPLGVLIGSKEFRGKKHIVRFINTFMGIPPVVAGLVVYMSLSRNGPFGGFGLLFTPAAMIIAQVIIVFPIITGLVISAVKPKVKIIWETGKGLGLNESEILRLLFFECKYPIISAIMAGYGRAISEVGAIMLVGGNVQHRTRVMTTAIVLETGKGNFDIALALGIILLSISFVINYLVHRIQEGK
ncbi:ABC transporter permease subunit [Alkalibaculum sp. M08DMB]|uniref:ABC transporter permease subunit n=2 Tax=Alkalibaculum sporogenes TaxID=2655001 RepID=A0A6A7KCC1_9FIRM|nr:ABC transporter permease subunit [Alkalibaculum sporogenes]